MKPMSIRSLIILLGAFLLALEPALPPASLTGIQKQDLEASTAIKGLCGLAKVTSHKPSLCGGTQAAGLYAADSVPVNRGFFAPAPTAKWVSQSRFFYPESFLSMNARLLASLPSFKAEPISPPPRA